MTDEPKRPAAVVWMERPDGRVLALTRGDDFADWHLPGGKWELRDGCEADPADDPSLPQDVGALIDRGNSEAAEMLGKTLGWNMRRPNLRATACREFSEETGVHLDPASLVFVTDYVTRIGRPVLAFVAPLPSWVPDRFPRYPEGQPAWVPREMLATSSCSFAHEFLGLQRAVKSERDDL